MQYLLCPRCQFKVQVTRHLCATCGYKIPSTNPPKAINSAELVSGQSLQKSSLWQVLGLVPHAKGAKEAGRDEPALGEV